MSDVAKWLRDLLAYVTGKTDVMCLIDDLSNVASQQHEALILALCCCETKNTCWLHDESLDESMKQWTNERAIAKWGNARGAIKAAEALKEKYG